MAAPDQANQQPAWLADPPRRPRVLLLGFGDRGSVAQEAERLRPVIENSAEIVGFDLEFSQDLSAINADIAVVLGGDGSILRAANQMGTQQIPVVGVNLGKLGFLADLMPSDFVSRFADICAGRCRVVEHLMLSCQVLREGVLFHEELGLNEMAILAGPPFSMLNVDLYVDAELATTYSCDGLIISTPVGSTAHNLSAGGPILRKSLQAFVISPISPHTLTVRPVVDSAEHVYEAVVRQPNETTSVVVDGRTICNLTAKDRVRVTRAESTFQLVEVHGRNYYRTLREKLGWGGDIERRTSNEKERRPPNGERPTSGE
ncbi:MAG: NAD(+)/NADH kinase [Planctomycetaceae bacterium]|nr:NAD(+)/NADH kinase [Planctomycetales bacterium]MCB9926913.1 NAD(+)/NADH kinase [Planctomycetaceae bacterium]